MEDVKVRITKRSNSPYWKAYYFHPTTGKQKFKSTGEVKRRDAERWAAKWEADLQEGRFKPSSKITWDEFVDRFEDEYLTSLKPNSQDTYLTVLRTVKRILGIKKLRDLTTQRISQYQAALREEGKAKATVANYSRHIRAALNWAIEMGMLSVKPKIRMPKKAKGKAMKGRPVTPEEFDRILMKLDDVVSTGAVPSWEFYMQGLWLSGLRFSESMNLYWDGTKGITIDLDRDIPVMIIPGEEQKSNRNQELFLTPDFAAHLSKVPREQRTGNVFKLLGRSLKPIRSPDWIKSIISDIGKAALVKVIDQNGVVKFATAHDLRRAFGLRWSKRVMPAVLKGMMRHADISTTMDYYVSEDAQSMADAVWGKQNMNDLMNGREIEAEVDHDS